MAKLSQGKINLFWYQGNNSFAQSLMSTAQQSLVQLASVFNLRLLAELLGTGISAAQLQPVQTQVELLDRYWQERIIRHDGAGDARELVLQRTTNAMVEQRALRIQRTAAIANDAASSAFLTDLLSNNVLAEWTTQAGTTQREFLTFPHHLLFDYAVARRSIPSQHHDFVARLTAEPDLFIAIRPSIDFHFLRLWHSDQASFWDLVFRTIAAPIPEIGKLIGPSVAAQHATHVSEFQLLLNRLNQTNPIAHEEGMAVLRHVLTTLVTNATTNTRFTPSPWCTLLDTSTTTITLDLAFAARPSVWFLADHVAALTPQERAHLGQVARRLLTYALSIAPDDRELLTVGITAVNKTVTTDQAASIGLLRQCLTPEHLSTVGYRTLRTLAEGVPAIACIDTSFVHDLYQAALRHQDTSTAVTTIGYSQIMPFTSNQQQDYRSGLYQLGQHYPAFLRAEPTSAATTLLAAIQEFAREHHTNTQRRLTVHLDDIQATLIQDGSAGWDSSGVYANYLPITMLNQMQTHLEALADQPDNQTTLQNILQTLTGTPIPALVWRRLLIAGTNRPTTLGRRLRSLAWDHTILASPDTTRLAGAFAHAIHPTLDGADRERIEHAILAIGTTGPVGTHDRNRLLGCLEQKDLASNAAREEYTMIEQQGGPPPNSDEDSGFGWTTFPVAPIQNDTLAALLEPIRTFVAQYPNGAPDNAAIVSILPRIQDLHNAITSPTDAVTPELETQATTELIRACATIARSGDLTNDQQEFLLPIALRATNHPCPEHNEEEDQAQPVTGWSGAPRICAAETLILFARYAACCMTEVQTAIRRLSTDPVRVVRLQIASHLCCLYHTAPDLLWDLLEYDAATEPNPTVLVYALQALRRIPIKHAARTAALTQQIFNRTTTDAKRNNVHDACIHIFCQLFLHANDATSTAVIERIIADPTTHAPDVQHLILTLSCTFTATEQPIRTSTFALTHRALNNIISAMRAIEAANQGLAQWPNTAREQYTGLMLSADQAAQSLYLASGAFNNSSNERTFLPPDVFYEHAKPLIVLLADIGHPHIAHSLLDTLEYFIAVDPPGVLLLVGHVVRAGSKYGYQSEPLAEGLMVEIVERYLAEYRPVLREHRECHAALMDVLDIFVRVGWPRAHQLTYQLSEIYR